MDSSRPASLPKVRDVLVELENIAPRRFALGFDKVGLQVGDLDQPVTRAIVSLDRSLGAVRYAAETRAQLLLSHHPLIFTPLDTVDTRSHEGRTVIELIRNGIGFIAAHTNWDAAKGGINDVLAEIFGLEDVAPFGMCAEVPQLKLVFTCPPEHAQLVVDAASEAGAGVVGAYSRCAFTATGKGTFIGDDMSAPTVGQAGRQETVEEVRVEMVLRQASANAVARAVRKAHPYEEPAIDFLVLRGFDEQPLGRIGRLPAPMVLSEFAANADRLLDARCWTWGDPSKRIKKVGIVGGAADTSWMDAQRAGADVLLTGEVKQHVGLEGVESGMTLVAAGHYQTEHPGAAALCDRMEAAMPEIEWLLFTPERGMNGRPY